MARFIEPERKVSDRLDTLTGTDEATALRTIYGQLPNNNNDLRKTLATIFNDPNDPNTQSANLLSGILYPKIEKRLVDLGGGNFKQEVFAPEGKKLSG